MKTRRSPGTQVNSPHSLNMNRFKTGMFGAPVGRTPMFRRSIPAMMLFILLASLIASGVAAESPEETQAMGGVAEQYRAAIECVNAMEQVKAFTYDAAETANINGRKVFILFGDVIRQAPAEPSPDFVSEARAMVVLIDNQLSKRRLQVAVLIDTYKVDGISRPPVRDIFDRWAVAIAEEIDF
ncbi:MAG: hypothetical protein KJ645_05035 [Planctomycetes bacterium]|nr:hypothetical protein [Planctomycetota bacterium]